MITHRRRKFAAIALAAILLATALASGGAALPKMGMPLDSDSTDWVALYYAETGEKAGGSSATGFGSGSGVSSASSLYPYANFKKSISDYAAVNPDIKGWLHIPNTNMSSPIAFNGSQDNNYYLYRDWKGTNYPGITWQNWSSYPNCVTYLDYRTKLNSSWNASSWNMVLYGHNWNNLRAPFGIGNYDNLTMFGQLPSYTDINFATKNPHIYFSTGEMEGIWRVFAVGYTVNTPKFFYNSPNPGKEQRQFLVDEWRDYSLFDFNVEVDSTDRLLTLTTCTRQYPNLGDAQRFVVVARLLREGESENDVVTATVNPDIQAPTAALG
ncbi:MAG: class B sortase [Oscillospiraceae bacterium]|nr:class B sortase [Oscillospiraceae bacterium]